MWQVNRTVVLEPRAQTEIDKYTQDVERFDEIWRGIEWLLARTPEVGAPKVVADGRGSGNRAQHPKQDFAGEIHDGFPAAMHGSYWSETASGLGRINRL